MQPGETALLYGGLARSAMPRAHPRPGLIFPTSACSCCSEEGAGSVDLELKDIEELRPDKSGVIVVSKKHGLLKLKLPDPKRWLGALRQAVRN